METGNTQILKPHDEDRIPFILTLLIACLSAVLLLGQMTEPARGAETGPSDLVKKGRQVFTTAGGVGCAACHGAYAEGDLGIGPYNRGVEEQKIRDALVSVEAMSFLREEMNEAKIKGIAAYYTWLGELQLVKTLAKRGRFIPDRLQIYPGTKVQLVIKNASSFPRKFGGGNMNIGTVKVAGRESLDMVWRAPAKEGSYTLECLDCRIKGQKLTLEISKSAKPHRGVKPAAIAVAAKTPAQPPARRNPEAVQKGRELFRTAGEVGCDACHGNYAEGDVGIGPYNRGFSEKKIRLALDKVEVMKFLKKELSDGQVKQVAEYYGWLGEHKLIKTVAVKGRFFPNIIRVHPGTPVQLVISNQDREPHAYTSRTMGIPPISAGGRERGDAIWTAPAGEGEFVLRCANCGDQFHKLTIEVSKEAEKFRPR